MKLSIPAKAAGLSAIVLGIVGPIQLAIAASWAPVDRTPLRLGLLFVAPYVAYITSAAIFAWVIVRGRTRRLTRVLDAIAAGNLRSELEPLLDSDLDSVRRSLVTMRDALDELTTELRHTDSQRRRLFADLAHELATPTTTILATAEAFGNPDLCKTDEDRARLAKCLDDEALRLSRLVRDVRDLARLDDPDIALELAEVDVCELARRAAERIDLTDSTRSPIRVTADSAPRIRVDAQRIDQVLMNLLSNARRYTPSDGVIALAVTAEPRAVRIAVEDNGTGVPDEALARLGERLYRVDPSRTAKTGGTGLGLSIVAAVVHRHGGALRFERASIGGLRVVVELPTS